MSRRSKSNEPRERVIIIGAAGRDFHNFNTFYRDNAHYEVVGFTAEQIPGISGRTYPPELAGKLYPNGIPIWEEKDLEKKIAEEKVDTCVLSYSDLNKQTVWTIQNRVLGAHANFETLGYRNTSLQSSKPVIAITAVRTGCGKSQVSVYVCAVLKKLGLVPVVVRHPMPYGDLAAQAVQRFTSYQDLVDQKVTIEEREEYEQHIDTGTVLYAGVDYEAILRKAEAEADVVIWEGGNNDLPFFKADLWIAIADPFRAGHEVNYYPGSTNFRAADIVIINKVNTGPKEGIQTIRDNKKLVNPKALLIETTSEVYVDKPELIAGKRVLCVDDGPTCTHGEMPFGAAKIAADQGKASEIVLPRKYAKGSLIGVFDKWPNVKLVLPAMGYSEEQTKDLEASIDAVECDSVIIGTPMNLPKLIKINKPFTVAKYKIVDREGQPSLAEEIKKFTEKHPKGSSTTEEAPAPKKASKKRKM